MNNPVTFFRDLKHDSKPIPRLTVACQDRVYSLWLYSHLGAYPEIEALSGANSSARDHKTFSDITAYREYLAKLDAVIRAKGGGFRVEAHTLDGGWSTVHITCVPAMPHTQSQPTVDTQDQAVADAQGQVATDAHQHPYKVFYINEDYDLVSQEFSDAVELRVRPNASVILPVDAVAADKFAEIHDNYATWLPRDLTINILYLLGQHPFFSFRLDRLEHVTGLSKPDTSATASKSNIKKWLRYNIPYIPSLATILSILNILALPLLFIYFIKIIEINHEIEKLDIYYALSSQNPTQAVKTTGLESVKYSKHPNKKPEEKESPQTVQPSPKTQLSLLKLREVATKSTDPNLKQLWRNYFSDPQVPDSLDLTNNPCNDKDKMCLGLIKLPLVIAIMGNPELQAKPSIATFINNENSPSLNTPDEVAKAYNDATSGRHTTTTHLLPSSLKADSFLLFLLAQPQMVDMKTAFGALFPAWIKPSPPTAEKAVDEFDKSISSLDAK